MYFSFQFSSSQNNCCYFAIKCLYVCWLRFLWPQLFSIQPMNILFPLLLAYWYYALFKTKAECMFLQGFFENVAFSQKWHFISLKMKLLQNSFQSQYFKKLCLFGKQRFLSCNVRVCAFILIVWHQTVHRVCCWHGAIFCTFKRIHIHTQLLSPYVAEQRQQSAYVVAFICWLVTQYVVGLGYNRACCFSAIVILLDC